MQNLWAELGNLAGVLHEGIWLSPSAATRGQRCVLKLLPQRNLLISYANEYKNSTITLVK
jgi:hypothetical protein